MAIKTRLVQAGATALVAAAGWLAYQFEGEHFKPYTDPVGIPTVCVGETGRAVVLGKTYTPEECARLYVDSLNTAASHVQRCTPSVPEGMKPALISFTFNVGGGAYCRSTLARKANAGDLVGACKELLRWTYAGGRELPGLVRRRKAEADLCLRGI